MIKAVIFDRDGVIIDSEWTNVESARQTFKEIGISVTEEDLEHVPGRHPDQYLPFFQKKYKFSYDEYRKKQRENYYKLFHTTPLFDKAIALIKTLHSKKIKIALATNSRIESTRWLLKRAELEGVFDIMVHFGDFEKRKPDPEAYTLTAKKLGLKPEECVVIEDSGFGLEAAKAAGMKCIVIPNKFTKDHDLSKADLVVKDADELDWDRISSL